jgi:DNA mismatch repair ATPase MutL
LLQPVKFSVTDIPDLQEKITQLNELWFDCSLLSENVMVVYAVPNIFITYPVDLETLFNYVLYLEDINFNHVLDGVFATKACKTSIKAWHKLSYEQMANLIKEWFDSIEGMFVCQHWRPFFVKIEKGSVDKMFDR